MGEREKEEQELLKCRKMAEMEEQKKNKQPIEKLEKTEAVACMGVEDMPDGGFTTDEKLAVTEAMIEEAQPIESNLEQQFVNEGQEVPEDQFESFFYHQPLEEPQVTEQEFTDELMWQPVDEGRNFQNNIQVNQEPQVKKDKRKKKNQEPNFQLPKVEMP